MLCILHELGLHRRSDGSFDTSAFKIVYVAPMKALVAEMVGNFTKRLSEAYGLTVRELTGKSSCHLPWESIGSRSLPFVYSAFQTLVWCLGWQDNVSMGSCC